jgi:MFS family permease
MSAPIFDSFGAAADETASERSGKVVVTSPEIAGGASTSLGRNRDYVLLWSGQVVSSVGSRVSLVAFPLLLLLVSHSPAQAGLVTALRGIPYVVLMLPAGALIDRWDRKRVMVLWDSLRAVALGSVALGVLLGRLTLAQICVVALIDGVGEVFFGLAHVSAIPRVVPKEQLSAASALDQAMDSMAWLLGPSLGGVLFGLAPGLPFLIDAISYVCSVVTLLSIRTRFQGDRAPQPMTVSRLLRETGEGLLWLWREPVLRFLAILTGVLMTCVAGYTLLVIVVAQRMHASDAMIGLVLGAGGIGGLVGALITEPLRRRLGFRRLLIVSAWAWALTWPPFAFAPNPLVLGLTLGASFVCVPLFLATQFSYRLAVIPDALQGRVSGVFRIIAFGSTPLGLAMTGLLLQRFGPVVTVLATFVPQLALAILTGLNRRLRMEER